MLAKQRNEAIRHVIAYVFTIVMAVFSGVYLKMVSEKE